MFNTILYTLRYFKLKQALADSCLLLASILKRKWQGDGIGHYPSSPSLNEWKLRERQGHEKDCFRMF